MKTKLLTICLLLSLHSYGQKNPKGGGNSGAAGAGTASASSSTAGATTSGAANAQTGFVYALKYKRHLQYASANTEVYYFTKAQLDRLKIPTIMGIDVSANQKISATFIFDRKNNRYRADGHSFLEYDFRNAQFYKSQYSFSAGDGIDHTLDTIFIVRVLYYDSLPRYWNIDRNFRLLGRSRLRIAINQDSAILNARLFNTAYNENVNEDTRAATNPYKIIMTNSIKASQRVIPVRRQNDYLYNTNELSGNTCFVSFQKPHGPSSGAIDDTIPVKQIDSDYASQLANYQQVAKQYKIKLATYQTHNLASVAISLAQNEFEDLLKDYRQLVSQQASLYSSYLIEVKKFKDSLDNDKAALDQNVADDDSHALAALKFLQDVYTLKTSPIQAPGNLPADIFDDEVQETAIPISGTDSSSNFYLKVIHKGIAREPLFFKSLHYGAWDYGTSTVPFRYRFPRNDAHIIVTSGVPASAITVPSYSETNINLNVYFGRKWGHTRFFEDPAMTKNTLSVEVALLMGPSLVPMSLSNVDSSSKYVKNSSYAYTGPSNIIAWSFGSGVMIQWGKINFGLFGGLDLPLIKDIDWVYAHRPWIGFGIGVNLGMLTSGNSVN